MRRIARPFILLAAIAASALTAVPAGAAVLGSSAPPPASALCPGATTATFGPNVCVFTPGMSQTDVQNALNAIATQQVPIDSQFNSQRYSVFFEPGTYGSKADPLVFQVGYYTQVAGLGALPSDTVVNGAIDVFNNLCTAGTSNCNADDNFWRSLSNLTLNVTLPSSPPVYAPPVQDPFSAAAPTPGSSGRPPRPRRSAGPSSTAASSSRTTARTTTSPAAGSSPTARSAAT